MPDVSPRVVARAAFIAAGLNLIAALAIVTVLRPGLPGPEGSVELRRAYVLEHPALWSLGWLTWHAAAIGLLAFYVGLAGLWLNRAPVRCVLGMLAGCAGLAVDLSGQALYLGLPRWLDVPGFALLERAALMLTGYVGNGLYTLGGVLITWAGAAEMPRGLMWLSVPVWLAGVALSVASLSQSPVGQIASTAILMPTLVLWMTLVGRWLRRRAS